MTAIRLFISLCLGWAVVVATALLIILQDNSIELSSDQAAEVLNRQGLSSISIDSQKLYLHSNTHNTYYIPIAALVKQNLQDIDSLAALPLTPRLSYHEKLLYGALILVIGLVLLALWHVIKSRKQSSSHLSPSESLQASSTESTSRLERETNPNDMSLALAPLTSTVRFKDIAGVGEAKEELLEIIDYLKNPKKYQDLGIYLPKGVLLAGPPGVGKTLIAKAVAGESKVPFFYQSGSSFVQMYVGIGAQRVRELFARARARAPSIIFIDEIDAIGKTRGLDNNQEWESTLNELLTQMDGFGDQSGVIVIAATNQAENIDSALLRSGRFDRRIFVDLPDLKEREEILKVYLKDKPNDLNIHEVASLCVGFSGANLASLVNEAALNALRQGRASLSMQDILATTDKVLFGKKKQSTLSSAQRRIIAIYRAGQAISQYWLLPNFEKISLIAPTSQRPDLHPCLLKSELEAYIKIALGGNLALQIEGLESASIGKADLKWAKELATTMCKDYGMGATLVGTPEDSLEILQQAWQEHKDFLLSQKDRLAVVAKALLEKERLNKEELAALLAF